MPSKRTKDLDLASSKSGTYLPLDSGSLTEARRYPLDNLLGSEDIRIGSTSLSVGANVVLFSDIATTNYLVFINCYDSEGTISCLITNKLSDRFTATVSYAATLDYIIFKTS